MRKSFLLLFFKKEGPRFVCFGKEKMDFQFSDDQRLLKDSVDRLIGPAYDDLGHRKKMQATELGYDEALWAKYAELGLLALPFSEEEGGFGDEEAGEVGTHDPAAGEGFGELVGVVGFEAEAVEDFAGAGF